MKKIISIVLMSLFLTSCASVKDVSDMLANVTKESSGDAASVISMMVYAEDNININASNEPTPVSFIVLELKNDAKLYAQDYEALSGDIEKALGKSYLNHEEYMVEPGKFVNVEAFEVQKGTRYIAVVSAYRALDKTIWRASAKIADKGEVYAIHTVLKQKLVNMELKK